MHDDATDLRLAAPLADEALVVVAEAGKGVEDVEGMRQDPGVGEVLPEDRIAGLLDDLLDRAHGVHKMALSSDEDQEEVAINA